MIRTAINADEYMVFKKSFLGLEALNATRLERSWLLSLGSVACRYMTKQIGKHSISQSFDRTIQNAAVAASGLCFLNLVPSYITWNLSRSRKSVPRKPELSMFIISFVTVLEFAVTVLEFTD